MDYAKFKAAVQRSNECLERWLSLQEAASRLLANAGNIIQRLPALSDKRNYLGLAGSPDQLQQLTLSKQVRALESVFGRLQANLSECEEVVRSQERLAVEAWRLLGEVPGVRAACCEVQAGGVTIAQLVEAMEDVWRCCRDDLAVRAAAVACLSHTTSPREFAELEAAVAASTGGTQPGSPLVVLMGSVAAALRA